MIRIEPGRQRPATVLLEDYETPFGDYLGAVAEDAWAWNPLQAGRRMAELDMAEAGYLRDGQIVGSAFESPPAPPRLSADQAAARYGDLGLSFPDGVAEPVAEIMAERKRSEIARKDLMERASPGIGGQAAALAVGLGVSLADPLNIASAFVPIVGEARYAAWAARFGKTGARIAKGAIEGAAGAAMIEPFLLATARREQADYDVMDSLVNLAFGTVIGGGLHAVGGAAADALRRRSAAGRIEELVSQEREVLLRQAVQQLSTGHQVDVEAFARAFRASDELAADFDRFFSGEGRAVAVPDDPLTPSAPAGRSLAEAPAADWSPGPLSDSGRYEGYEIAPGDRRWIEGVVAELEQSHEGHRLFREVDGQGSTPDILGVKGNTPAWFTRHNDQARKLAKQRQRDTAAGRAPQGPAPVPLTREKVRTVAAKLREGVSLTRTEGDVALAIMGAAREARAENARQMVRARADRQARRDAEYEAFAAREAADGAADSEASAAFDDLVMAPGPAEPAAPARTAFADVEAEAEAAIPQLEALRAAGLLDEGDEALLREADALVAESEIWGRAAEAAAFCMARRA